MRQMHLHASLPEPPYGFQPFAALDASSDKVRRHDETFIRRDITGAVTRQFEPMWRRFWGTWGTANTNPVVQSVIPAFLKPFTMDGRDYVTVRNLQVDYDHYPQAWVNLEGDTLRVVVMETFRKPIEGYPAALVERNERMHKRVADAHAGNVTKNDLRELLGLPWNEHFQDRLDPDALQKYLAHPDWKSSTYNLIV